MASHSFTVASTLSPEDAFARLVDLERVPEWDEGISAAQRIDDGDSPLGARFAVIVTGFDGQPTSVVYEITEVDAPRRFVMVGQNDVFRAVDSLTLRPAGAGSTLLYLGTLELLGTEPPLTPDQLEAVFPKIAMVAEAGLTKFLNPA